MTKPLHIFRAGRHTAMSGQSFEFSEAEVEAVAAAYDPALHEAPIVVGHPRTDAPAYGWVKSLRAEGAELFAEPDQVEPAFAEMVRAGRFKRISASFYPPKASANPAPGSYYLKHVGFLGAQPPAVKGLKAAEFADDGEAVTLELDFSEAEIAGVASAGFGGLRRVVSGLRDWLLASQGQEVADGIVPAHELEGIRTTEEFMRNVMEREARPSDAAFAQTDLSRRLNARLDERAEDAAARSGLIDRMATEAGIERGTVLQILRGEIATPPEERLRGFAKVLGLKADDLIDLVDLAETEEGETDMSGKDTRTPEERQAALDAREAEIAAREAAFAEERGRARRDADAALLDELVEDGRIAPGLKDEMAAFMEALDAEEEITFAEGQACRTPRDWFRDLLSSRTRQLIDFSERAGGETVPQIKSHEDVTAAAKRLVAAAKTEGRALSFSEAVREVADTMEADNA